MASITSLGVGSGLDAEGIISKLMQVESQPLQQLQKQESALKTQLSSFGQMKSLFADLQSASSALSSISLWNQTAATSSDTSTITATSASGAAAGSYSIAVSALATGQTVTSGAYATSDTVVGTGTLTIQLGAYSGGTPPTTFTPGSTAAVNVTIDSAHSSLASIRDQINLANAGVTASIINDASGARLSIRSSSTGANSAFQITSSGTLSALNYDATNAGSPMTRTETAQNAQATINGIAVSSATNTLTNVVDGLTLNLAKTTTSPVTVTVGADTDAIHKSIDGFVKAFNALASYIHDQTKYDAASKTGGPLQGNRTAVSMQNQLRAVLNQASSASSVFGTLSDIGITMGTDGTLSTNSTKLGNALNNLPELRKVLATDSGIDASSGFMVRYNKLATSVLDISGALSSATDGLSSRIKTYDQQQDDMNTRLAATEARLRAQYQALDTQMAQMSGLSSYLTNQLAALAKQG